MTESTLKLTIVLSQGQSRSPEKRALEEAIADRAGQWHDVQICVIPHLYDLTADGPSIQRIRAIHGPIVILSWMYERAAHWVLNRLGVKGSLVATELSMRDDEEDEDDYDPANEAETTDPLKFDADPRVIYSIDLRSSTEVEDYVTELRRLADAQSVPVTVAASVDTAVAPSAKSAKLNNLAHLFMDEALAAADEVDDSMSLVHMLANGNGQHSSNGSHAPTSGTSPSVVRIDEHPTRRWYPVIDFSRCTNCMECIDFCLFGVYGVDSNESILVEQPDNCRKGCPACSRVCPANAIMFPQHKTPAIAGAPGDGGSFKIDLSKLFGAPETDEDAAAVAARERDEQLLLAGRPAVGAEGGQSGVGTRTTSIVRSQWSADEAKKDGLDNLLDQLDDLDL